MDAGVIAVVIFGLVRAASAIMAMPETPEYEGL